MILKRCARLFTPMAGGIRHLAMSLFIVCLRFLCQGLCSILSSVCSAPLAHSHLALLSRLCVPGLLGSHSRPCLASCPAWPASLLSFALGTHLSLLWYQHHGSRNQSHLCFLTLLPSLGLSWLRVLSSRLLQVAPLSPFPGLLSGFLGCVFLLQVSSHAISSPASLGVLQ